MSLRDFWIEKATLSDGEPFEGWFEPNSHAWIRLLELFDVSKKLFVQTTPSEFFDNAIAPMLADPGTEYRYQGTKTFGDGRDLTTELLLIGCACVVDALNACKAGKPRIAWPALTMAAYILGKIDEESDPIEIVDRQSLRRSAFRALGKDGLDIRHAPNRQVKAAALRWADNNWKSFKSLDQSLNQMARKLVELGIVAKYSTARGYMTEWNAVNKKF